MRIVDMKHERELIDVELAEFRQLASTFKKQEERNQRLIAELEMKIQLLNEEKIAQAKNFDLRFNSAVRDFVADRAKLKAAFEGFK
jgi:hypothetical protein